MSKKKVLEAYNNFKRELGNLVLELANDPSNTGEIKPGNLSINEYKNSPVPTWEALYYYLDDQGRITAIRFWFNLVRHSRYINYIPKDLEKRNGIDIEVIV